MSNIKFYTEEQVKKQKEILEDIIDLWDEGYPLDSNTVNKCKNALLELTPIELPSDENIEEKAEFLFPTVNRMGGPTYIAHKSFIEGAKWMKDKILNQTK